MPTTLVAPLLLLLGMGVFSGRQDGVQSRGDSIRYSLTAEEAYRADQPITIGFTFENVSRAELWILTWNTPLEGLRGRIFSVSCGGIDIPYLGPVVKRGDPTIREYHHLPPGEQITEAVDLSLGYDFSNARGDNCQVAFKGLLHDVSGNRSELPRTRQMHVSRRVIGNDVAFRLIPN